MTTKKKPDYVQEGNLLVKWGLVLTLAVVGGLWLNHGTFDPVFLIVTGSLGLMFLLALVFGSRHV